MVDPAETLPPGPRIPVAWQTLRFWSRPEALLHSTRLRFGNVFTLRVAPVGDIVFLGDAAVIKEVFTGPTDLFHAGEGNGILAPVMGKRSVLLLDEDEHLRRRKSMLPAFHGERVRKQVDLIRALAADEVGRWPLGRPFALLDRFQALTLEVILQVVFGVRDDARLDRLRALLPRVVELPTWLLLMWLRPELASIPPWRGFTRLLATVDDLLLDEIAERRRATDLDERHDVLSMLVGARDENGAGMDDRDLRDQLMTLLLAGHETTATALSWTFERVLRHPAVEARLRAAVADNDDEYIDAVVKEILRVRPVIDRVARRVTRPVELGGHRLPAGTRVAPAISLIQLDAAHYDDPWTFRPQRWLEPPTGSGYSWLPYGGGTRRCLGATFANVEMREVIRIVISSCDLHADRPASEKQIGRHITISPARRARVVRQT